MCMTSRAAAFHIFCVQVGFHTKTAWGVEISVRPAVCAVKKSGSPFLAQAIVAQPILFDVVLSEGGRCHRGRRGIRM